MSTNVHLGCMADPTVASLNLILDNFGTNLGGPLIMMTCLTAVISGAGTDYSGTLASISSWTTCLGLGFWLWSQAPWPWDCR